MNNYIKTIESITNIRNITNYLEIGVFTGSTFLPLNFTQKTGVDPDFKFDISKYVDDPNILLFPMTSNQFFSSLPEFQEKLYSCRSPFDLIFIDGLHTFEQAYTDFTNTISYSSDTTIWILDDVIPSDPYSAIPDQAKAMRLRKLANLSGTPWHGDVFKVLYALHDLHPHYSYVTIIDNGNPHALVWKTSDPSSRTKLFGSIEEIDKMSYFDMCDTCAILNPVPLTEALQLIGSQIDVPVQISSTILPSIIKKLKTI